mmetsp:Transcript_41508/g.99754  ORF Transcript_41508/g.99754 Transcript_41508/m.99754 type:complete len:284 (-) Transcript_41508:112-963(-)
MDVLPLLEVHVEIPARGVGYVGLVPCHVVSEDELHCGGVVEGQRRAVMLQPDGLRCEVDRVLRLAVHAFEALGPPLRVRVVLAVRHHLEGHDAHAAAAAARGAAALGGAEVAHAEGEMVVAVRRARPPQPVHARLPHDAQRVAALVPHGPRPVALRAAQPRGDGQVVEQQVATVVLPHPFGPEQPSAGVEVDLAQHELPTDAEAQLKGSVLHQVAIHHLAQRLGSPGELVRHAAGQRIERARDLRAHRRELVRQHGHRLTVLVLARRHARPDEARRHRLPASK